MSNMTKHFIKKVEDFICEKCGATVHGTGYTNHCPKCLYSKHVDLDIPGDRLNPCQGLMKPIAVELQKNQYFIKHQCLKCGYQKRNKFQDDDNFDILIDICAKKKR